MRQAAFDSLWIEAFENGRFAELDSFVVHHRLKVKPFAERFIRESIRASLDGTPSEARHLERIVIDAAQRFRRQHGERSLMTSASYLNGWTPHEKSLKLTADSLYEAGTAKRGSSSTRDDARNDYDQALSIYRSIGDRPGEGAALGGLGVVYWFQGDADSVRSIFEQALSVRQEADDRQLVGNSYHDLGSVYRGFFRDYDRALSFYARAEAVREEIGDLEGLARTLTFTASTYEILGDLQQAVAHYERAARASERAGDRGGTASAMLGAAVGLTDLGRHSDALALLTDALAIQRDRGDDGAVADVLNWTGVVHRRLGDFASALQNYERVIEMAERAGDDVALAHVYSNIGVVYLSAERPERAASYSEQALEKFERLEDERGMLGALINLGSSQVELRAYEPAAGFARRALDLSRSLDDPVNETTALILLGNALSKSDSLEQARAYQEEGLEKARMLKMPSLIWTGLMGLGETAELAEEYEKALGMYEQAFDVLENTRGGLETEEDKAGFLAQQRYLYEDVFDLANTLHEQEPEADYHRRAFDFAERAKARAFLDLLTEALENVSAGVDPALIQRRQELLGKMSTVRAELQAAAHDGDEAAEVDHEAELRRIEADYEQLRRDIRRENPRFSELQYPNPVTLEQVQAELLDEGTVLLQYALGDSSSSMWAVSDTGMEMYTLPARDVMKENVELLRFSLERPSESNPELFARTSRRLYEMLVEPARSMIPEGANLVVIPDDVLYYLPFEVLLSDGDDLSSFRDLPYLIRHHPISYGPSASVLVRLRERRNSANPLRKEFLAVADPVFDAEDESAGDGSRLAASGDLQRLPFTGDEVRAIAQFFPRSEVDLLLREDATETRLKAIESLDAYRYIHFATHGLINERRPDFSSLALAYESDSPEDGLLQAAEIFDLRLNADLIVLSACQTGIGTMVRGEGMVGLTRAFMYAGTPSLLVSLWAVADQSTSELMQHFYRGLLVGDEAKAAAAQQAKLTMLADERFAHPFHWAPFVLIGDWQ